MAYTMLVEEKIGKLVKKVVIKYLKGNKTFEIPLTDELRRHVLYVISRIKSIIEGEKLPRGNYKKRRNCGFMKICGEA
ncbi:MAG: Dna2/Cas4 domain-containing protein [Candidatus Nezhaarchaeales archaeon]